MKKILMVFMVSVLLIGLVLAAKPTEFDSRGVEKGWEKVNSECTTIQSGELYGSDGSLLTTGFNEWGYNYQAHIFNGNYCDYHPVYRPGGASHDWCVANYGDVNLVMKWNDAWLSNADCDGDGLLDRHYGFDSYIGSGAWTTNHMTGGEGEDSWTYFTKIVAKPSEDYECEEIWGSFCTIQEVNSGEGAILYDTPGFGVY